MTPDVLALCLSCALLGAAAMLGAILVAGAGRSKRAVRRIVAAHGIREDQDAELRDFEARRRAMRVLVTTLPRGRA